MTSVDPRLTTTRTTCPYCGVGCGVLATPDGKGGAAISGDPDHPANYGRLCSKGSALGETIGLETRLLFPMQRTNDAAYERSTWPQALDAIAGEFARIRDKHGPDSIAFYLSGQLLTEDYYVANKFMKGFIGTANVDTNSRLCMASSVAGHRRAFGSDTVPGNYEDLDTADLIVLVGSNAAWCHPVLFQRMVKNKTERGAKIVAIDPRRTASAEEADLFLGIKPGMDGVLFMGLLAHLAAHHALDHNYIAQFTNGFDDALKCAQDMAPSIQQTALATGLSVDDVATFFEMFRTHSNVVTCYSQGVNQSAQGTDKVNAIIDCHLATGRIGRPGMGPFSLTGQPNAMGGREVGGLANQLAAHMTFSDSDIDIVSRFWNAPAIARNEGLKAVDMFDAIERGQIKALWVMGTNPAVSLPRADHVRSALGKLELFVMAENVRSNDSIAAGAHWLLPAHAWGEKSGTVTNSERRISRQRSFMKAAGEARPDWWMVSEIARRLGFGRAFDYTSAADIFREHAALSAFENHGSRDFDIGNYEKISDDDYQLLAPFVWPHSKGSSTSTLRLFSEGGFFTADRKARFHTIIPPSLKTSCTDDFPLRLNTGRIRDQWHTMTRTGLSARLGLHLMEPFVEIHPDDAARYHIIDGQYAKLTNEHGTCILKAIVTDTQQQGSLFVPIHWNDETASRARIGSLVAPYVDPYSGQPEAKATPVAISPAVFSNQAFILSRGLIDFRKFNQGVLSETIKWSRIALSGGWGYLIASDMPIERLAAIVGFSNHDTDVAHEASGDITIYRDPARSVLRMASFANDQLVSCVFAGPFGEEVTWDSARALFAKENLSESERRSVLSGFAMSGDANDGPVICACFGVGKCKIEEAISHGTSDVQSLGAKLKAGTNCGSCIPEMKKIIATHAAEAVS